MKYVETRSTYIDKKKLRSVYSNHVDKLICLVAGALRDLT